MTSHDEWIECETCGGAGSIREVNDIKDTVGQEETCPDCNGTGGIDFTVWASSNKQEEYHEQDHGRVYIVIVGNILGLRQLWKLSKLHLPK